MFGFPFITSLIATIALVVTLSFVINKGMQKKKASKESDVLESGIASTKSDCHA
jgi:flagellar biogenesis protein FliO